MPGIDSHPPPNPDQDTQLNGQMKYYNSQTAGFWGNDLKLLHNPSVALINQSKHQLKESPTTQLPFSKVGELTVPMSVKEGNPQWLYCHRQVFVN